MQRFTCACGYGVFFESGHFYFDRLLRHSQTVFGFRALFGDERSDYTAALDAFYAQPPGLPGPQFVSSYAASHPLEDWAECWAHWLHIEDTLETAAAHGADTGSGHEHGDWLRSWDNVSVMLNELNRSMGLADAYPFVITEPVAAKLNFIRDLVRQAGHAIGSAAGR